MIRRDVDDECWLFTQHDHALMAAEVAAHFGNDAIASPAPREQTLLGIALHDCGWPLHDERPALNRNGLPMDVFETTRQWGLKIWTASASRAAAEDPYAGLLVSLHSLSLSVFATTQTGFLHEKFDIADPRARFDMNKFQHGQIELQEQLRRKIGLSTEHPLTHGLAEESDDESEQRLLFNFRLLQAMDKVSLCICCTQPPFRQIEPLLPRPGAAPVKLSVQRPDAQHLLLWPWPFDRPELNVLVPYRVVPRRAYSDEAQLHEAFADARLRHLYCTIAPGGDSQP
jgi:hypothetical protein